MFGAPQGTRDVSKVTFSVSCRNAKRLGNWSSINEKDACYV